MRTGGQPTSRDTSAVALNLKRVVVGTFVVTLCLCAICVKVLLDAREAAQRRATEIGDSLLATLSSEIARTIESYTLSMEGVVESLGYPEITQVTPEFRQAILFDRSATAKHLHAITLLDKDGIVRLDSRTPYPQPVNRSGRDFFRFHKEDRSSDLYVSAPFKTHTTQQQVIAISRRLSLPDGTFSGVIVGTIRFSYFQDLFKTAGRGFNGTIALSRTDSTQLARWPLEPWMIGRGFKNTSLFRSFPGAKSGHFETDSPADGVRRLVVYSQIGDLPLIVSVGQSTAAIFAEWRRYAFILSGILALLCLVSSTLTIYLTREIKRRAAAEGKLALLARTDGLTGLFNRRHFDESIDREWHRAAREGAPVALVMCDADLFKTYNDRFGHQAGDNLLKLIAGAIGESIRRDIDIVARYGGDEFAILLPGMSVEGAAGIAELVRGRVAEACIREEAGSSSLSIGVASLVPTAAQTPDVLVAMADAAAYRAKEQGRNRIEVAPVPADAAPATAGAGRQAAA